MRRYRKQTVGLLLALVLSATGSGTAMADVIIVGQSREQTETVGPGVGRAPGSQDGSGMPTSQGGDMPGTQDGGTAGSPQTAVYPAVPVEPAAGAVAGAVTVNADYGENGEILRMGLVLNNIKGTITYGVHVNPDIFLPWQADGGIAGGTENSTHVDAVQIALTGEAEKLYDVYYRGTSAIAGQHGWAGSEQLMGTVGRGDCLTSLEVVLVPKGAGMPGSYEGRFYSNHSESIRVQSSGSTYANGYTGWVDHDNARYYFLNGQAVTGWQYIDGLKFFFNDSGALIMDVDAFIGKQDSYIIKVNKLMNCATVYAKDGENGYIIPVKSMLTSTGDDTPVGTFRTPEKYRWRFMINDTWTQYATRINKGVLFHSITYSATNEKALITDGYNKLGVTRSHGCIRLTAANAKWVYDNCKLGTAVTVYNDPLVPGPFFKPYQKWIPAYQTWDPTDPACAGL